MSSRAIGGLRRHRREGHDRRPGPRGTSPAGPDVPERATVHRFAVERSSGTASRAWSPAPGTPARTAWNVRCRRRWRSSFWEAVLAEGVVPAGLGAATPCGSRPGCRSTGTSSARVSRPSRRAWAGSIGWDKDEFTGRPPWRRSGQPVRPAACAASSPTVVNPCATVRVCSRRGPGRHPDQRQLFADARTRHRSGLRRCRRATTRRRCDHAAPTGAGAGRSSCAHPCGRSERTRSSHPGCPAPGRCPVCGGTTEYAD